MSLFDLLVAQALLEGMARGTARDTPPPKNFFVLQPNPRSWQGLKEICKKGNNVIAVEVTNGDQESSRRMQQVFLNLAREHDELGFFRAPIEQPGFTFVELRADLGDVQYAPTFIVAFFRDGGISYAKFEGEEEIKSGIRTGKIDSRKWPKPVTERERRMKAEIEEKRRREQAEKEEQRAKEEAEKKRKEEEEQRARDEVRRREEEIRRQNRPQVVAELLKTDVDVASVKVTKELMAKLGISSVDCLSKEDLKKKLMDNVPEYRQAQQTQPYADPSVRRASSVPDEKQTKRLEMRAEAAEKECGGAGAAEAAAGGREGRHGETCDLNIQLRKMTEKVTSTENQVLAAAQRVQNSTANNGPDSFKVKQLELELLETRMLYTTTLENYDVIGVIHNNGPDGLVLKVKCTRNGIPNPDRMYAMKVLPSYQQQSSTVSNLQKSYRNEYQILCQLPPHENVIHLYAFFYDRADPALCAEFRHLGPNVRSLSLFLLLEELPVSMKAHVDSLIANKGPQVGDVLRWFEDLLRGLVFLESHCVAHRDLKMDNLLLSRNGRVVIADFGKAIVLNNKMETPYMHGLDIGGNEAHLGPEILNARPGPNRILSYLKQPVWSAGVLAYELAGHRNPFETGRLDQRAYEVLNIPPLEYTFCAAAVHSQRLPQKLSSLVQSMLAPDPVNRPTLTEALQRAQL
eukprot:Em0022g183a